LIADLFDVVGEGVFGGAGESAFAELIRAALHAVVEIVLIHGVERTAQFAGGAGLRGGEFTGCTTDLLRQARELIAGLLALIHHLVEFLGGRELGLLPGGALGGLL